ncbi:MAG: TetR/AcrR family transcriptional regulator [Streptosporangiaceae bacterium]
MLDVVAHIKHGTETPNQLGKQQQIIDAARDVLAREGLAGCTARSVADASPLTKSAVHYYFRDIDEIIDQAMAAHLEAMLGSLRQVAAGEPDPVRRLWSVVDAYLDTFAGNPHAARLWFEYWISLSRRAASGPVAGNLDRVRDLLRELLDGAGHPRPEAAADTIVSWLLGAVVQESVASRPGRQRQRELEQLIGGSWADA